MAKIFITGSEGSLMQQIIPLLHEKGHEIVGVDNLFRYGEQGANSFNIPYKFYQEDASNLSIEAKKDLLSSDFVIQAAARIFGVGGFHRYPADILGFDVSIQQHILSTIVAENSLKKTKQMPHVIFVSSSMVYERCQSQTFDGVKEGDFENVPPPLTEYGLSKYVGERLLKAYHKQYDIRYTIWRPFNIITPHETSQGEIGMSHVFADYIENIVHKKLNPLPIIGDGQQIRCFTWIGDIAECIAENITNPKIINEDFNVGNPEPYTMERLALEIYTVSQELGLIPKTKTPLKFSSIKNYKDDVRVRIPNVEKAYAQLGWKAKTKTFTSIETCLQKI